MTEEINVSECVKTMVFLTKNREKYKTKFLGRGPQTLHPSGEGIPPPHNPHPPLQRLRHLNPSHSKLLGTPLQLCEVTSCS